MVTRPIWVICCRNLVTSITEIERYIHCERKAKKPPHIRTAFLRRMGELPTLVHSVDRALTGGRLRSRWLLEPW